MNALLLVSFGFHFCVFAYLKWDLGHIQKALFPQILIEDKDGLYEKECEKLEE